MKFDRQSVKFYSIISDCKCFLVLIFIGVINGKFGNLSDPIAFGATLFGLEQKLLTIGCICCEGLFFKESKT